jgi:hypothetical protein
MHSSGNGIRCAPEQITTLPVRPYSGFRDEIGTSDKHGAGKSAYTFVKRNKHYQSLQQCRSRVC